MRIFVLAAVLGLTVCGAVVLGDGAATAPTTAPASTFKTEKERIGYAVGLQIGSKLKGVDVDGAALAAGVRDSSTGAKPQMTEREIQEAIQALQKQLQAAQVAAVAGNQKAGEAFLVENGKKEGVVTTASGLQYKVIKSGKGKTPKAADMVSVNYRGTLISGKEFDASGAEPVSFAANRVIPGWTEALQLMKEGDKWQLFIPSKLAYAEDGQGDIGPNEALIFEVELVAVK